MIQQSTEIYSRMSKKRRKLLSNMISCEVNTLSSFYLINDGLSNSSHFLCTVSCSLPLLFLAFHALCVLFAWVCVCVSSAWALCQRLTTPHRVWLCWRQWNVENVPGGAVFYCEMFLKHTGTKRLTLIRIENIHAQKVGKSTATATTRSTKVIKKCLHPSPICISLFENTNRNVCVCVFVWCNISVALCWWFK